MPGRSGIMPPDFGELPGRNFTLETGGVRSGSWVMGLNAVFAPFAGRAEAGFDQVETASWATITGEQTFPVLTSAKVRGGVKLGGFSAGSGLLRQGKMEEVTKFIDLHGRQAIEVIILWVIFYNTYLYFRATRGARIFTALVGIYIGMTLVSGWFDLTVIGWLLKYVSVILAIALVIIFQPELRRALAELGSHRFFSSINEKTRAKFADRLIEILETLSRKRTGALIAIERGIDLKQYLETGTQLDSLMSPELVYTVFHGGTTLHDGGMIVRMSDERIAGAGCVFPLIQRELSDQSIGLRHRAAMGITEESDSIALVVSEETGAISIAINGKLERDLEKTALSERLNGLLSNQGVDDGEEDDDGEA